MINSKTPFFKKLSSKIFAVIVTGTLFSVAAVGLFAFLFTKAALEQEIIKNQLEYAKQSMDKIDRMLYERYVDIQAIAGEDTFEMFLTEPQGGKNAQDSYLQKSLPKRINELTFVTGPWDVLFVVNTEGKIIVSANGMLLGNSIQADPLKAMAFNTSLKGEAYYSDLILSKETGKPSIIFSAPIFNHDDPSDPIIGVIVGNLSWPVISQILEGISMQSILLNHEGRVIASNRVYAKHDLLFEKIKSQTIERALSLNRPLSIISSKEETFLNERQLVSLAPQLGFLTYKGSGWGLLLDVPSNIAFAPAGSAALKLVSILIPIITLTSIFILVMIFKWVSHPIAILTQASREITAGNLNKRVPVMGQDEMGELANSFNVMTEKLHDLYASLETKVAGRTAALKQEIVARKRRERYILVQHSIANVLSGSGTYEEAAPKILQAICTGLDWKFGASWNVDTNLNIIRCSYVWHEPLIELQEFEEASFKASLSPGIGLPGRVWNSAEAAWVSNVTEDPNFSRVKEAAKAGLHAAFAFPILIDGNVIKVLEFFSFEFRQPDNDFLQIMEAIGIQIGHFIHHKKTESQLLQSQKMETVGSLAGGIAHDLNNQLTPIRGYLDLLLNEVPANDPIHLLLHEANQAAIRCTEVVRKIVGFSKRSTQKKTPLDLKRMLEEFKKLLENFLPSTIRVDIRFEKDIWTVLGNETELHTVLMNLAANAKDAMPNGGSLSIETKNVEMHEQTVKKGIPTGPYVVISTRDTGEGMHPETLKRIFEPFFTTKPKDKGTGLGLAMVYNIIKDHGGWIDVSSVVGVGTAFQIYLPAEKQTAGLAAEEKSPQEALPHGTETVLFADDEEKLRTLGKVFLERLGYQVLLASDGKEAVEIYKSRKNDIDVLILDMTMPHFTGRQTLQKILAINPAAKVILASGYNDEGTEEELIHQGAQAFIPKPFTIMPLAQILRKALDS